MNVLLLKAVDRLGPEGTVVKVKSGFARNFLIPRGLAAAASAQQVKVAAEGLRQRAAKVQRLKTQAEALRRTLEGQPVRLTLSVGADGKPFGALTNHDIFDALTQGGLALDKHAVQLAEPIKTLGIVDVPVRLHPEVTATVKVWVEKG